MEDFNKKQPAPTINYNVYTLVAKYPTTVLLFLGMFFNRNLAGLLFAVMFLSHSYLYYSTKCKCFFKAKLSSSE